MNAQSSVLTINLLIDILLGSSLKFMWNLVNTLQIIVYLNEVKANFSVEVKIFLEKLRVVALGEFIPYDWLKSYFSEKWNISVEQFDKLGSIGLILIALFAFTIIILLLGKVIDRLGYSRKIIDKVKKKLFWNTFLRTSLQAYIKVLYVYAVLALSIQFTGFIASIKSLFTILVIIILIALVPIYTLILVRNRNELGDQTIRDKIGSLYVGMRVKNYKHYLYAIVFLVRRLIYVSLLVSLEARPMLFS